ncbi:hypothetical protein M8J76_006685 [Diaphorina citri]|nr:hypothetical protein M8J76_006685 [Diaphorina citri]
MKSILVLLLINFITQTFSCNLNSPGARKGEGDGGFAIQISGSPDKYLPDTSYTITLTSSEKLPFQKFKLYLELAEPSGGNRTSNRAQNSSPGSLQLLPNDQLTEFDDDCTNTISEANATLKTQVQVMWLAPPTGNGCVRIKANVLANNQLYGDSGKLTREICEYTENKEEKYMDCCACDEARYKFIFEGLWRNETHPKDFPKSLWLTHFSDVVGGTHGKNFSFWGEGQIASPGLKQLAEWGATRIIDSELRSKSRHFRSLVKATGLWYPGVNANTSSTFRVDKRRNLISLVSMLGPSPDWLVGVSGLNLCLPNCTWIEGQVIDLYPYDAGTDNGVSYMSINIPAVPQEKIHKITPMYPEDERAPFYDPVNNFMYPLARLYITRDKLIKKSCDDKSVSEMMDEISIVDNEEEASRPECAVTPYTPWSNCSATCGKGLRMRSRTYVNPASARAAECDRQLVSKEMCIAENPTCPGEEEEEQVEGKECKVGEWEAWSECSVSCGQGLRTRVRRFPDKKTAKKCPHVELVEREPCIESPCTESVVDPLCPVTDWSDWSPCNASCGYGFKIHTRFLLADKQHEAECLQRVSLNETKRCKSPRGDCKVDMAEVKTTCMLPEDTGSCHSFNERFRFEPMKGMCIPFSYGGCGGNKNNFYTQAECLDFCRPIINLLDAPSSTNNITNVDCVLGEWGPWSECSVKCGRGYKMRTREVLVQAQGKGTPCPLVLTKRRMCRGVDCSEPKTPIVPTRYY